MRTTVDLPTDLHERAKAIARDTSRTLSETIADLMRRGLERETSDEIRIDELTGLPVISGGRTITSEDVRRLEEEEDERLWSSSTQAS